MPPIRVDLPLTVVARQGVVTDKTFSTTWELQFGPHVLSTMTVEDKITPQQAVRSLLKQFLASEPMLPRFGERI